MSSTASSSQDTPEAAGDEPAHMQSSQAQQQETCNSLAKIPLGDVHLCDINPGMLQEGFRKAQEKGLGTWQLWPLFKVNLGACYAGWHAMLLIAITSPALYIQAWSCMLHAKANPLLLQASLAPCTG